MSELNDETHSVDSEFYLLHERVLTPEQIAKISPYEMWKPCFRYEGLYVVSNGGRVARVLKDGSYRILNPRIMIKGTSRGVNLVSTARGSERRSNHIAIFRLVAIAFLGATMKSHIKKMDGNPENDRVDNLLVQPPKTIVDKVVPGKDAKIKGVWPEVRGGVVVRWIAMFRGETESFRKKQDAVNQRKKWVEEDLLRRKDEANKRREAKHGS